MTLTTVNGQILNVYYSLPLNLVGDCNKDNNTRLFGITPYDTQETIYWICKHLALPGIAALLIPIVIFLRIFENPIIEYTSYILWIIASFFILSVTRERIRARKFKIARGEIDYNEKIKEQLNTLDKVNFKIGFVGDIMKMKKFKLTFAEKVKIFFDDVSIIIGNLEGIVSKQSNSLTKQSHNPDILTRLATLLKDDTKWLLCVSNNHSIDFGNGNFHNSLKTIRSDPQFDVFGRNDVPNVLVENENILISTATEWSNQKNWDCTSWYKDNKIKSYHRAEKFNILYPHCGFENEKYVRTRVQLDARALLTGKIQHYSGFQDFIRERFHKKIEPDPNKKWDLIFGSHSHVRQPLMKVEEVVKKPNGEVVTKSNGEVLKIKKLVAFSGGNFTSGANIIRRKKHIYGFIMKCEIGPLKGYAEKLAIGEVEWRKTVNNKVKGAATRTKIVEFDKGTYRTYNLTALIIGFVTMGIIVILKLFEIFT